jgi:lipoprotein NlpI
MPDRKQQLESMLAQNPGDAFCTYALAMEFLKTGEHESAVTWFDRTLALDPSQCYAFFHKARSLAAAGRMDTARLTLQEGLARARACGDHKAASEIEGLLDDLS